MTELQVREQAPRLPARPVRPGVGRGPATESSFSIKDAWRIIQRHLLLEIIVLVVIVGLTVGLTVLWLNKWPVYRSTAYVKVTLPRETVLGNASYAHEALLERHLQTVMQLVKTDRVLLGALEDDQALRQTTWFQQFDPVADPLMTQARRVLSEDLNVGIVPDADLISISMSMATSDRQQVEELATIINAVARQFSEAANDATTTGWRESIRLLTTERDALEAELGEVQRTITARVQTMSVPAMTNQVNELSLESRDLTARIAELEREQLEAQAMLDTLRAQMQEGNVGNIPEVVMAIENDFSMRQQMQLEMQLMSRKENLLSRLGPNHPEVQEIEVQLRSTRNAIQDRRQEIVDTQLPMIVGMREQELAAITQQLNTFRQRRDELRGPLRDIEQARLAIENLENRRNEIETRMARLNQKLDDLSLLPNTPSATPASLYVPAEPPEERQHPQWKIMLPVGIVLGLGLALGLAFLLEFMDSSVKTPTDVTRRIDLPMLAMIPHEDDVEEEIEHFEKAVVEAPRSLVAESFRELRTNLLFSGPASQRRGLLVTSSSPEDGRTTVATNLAIAMASSGRKVLLVDANFRRPAMKTLFSQAKETGLSDALAGQAQWREVVSDTDVPNLSVLSSGSQVPPNPAELLGSDLAKTMLSEMQADYDQVVFDGPPLLLVSDGPVLSTLVDGVVVVIRAGENTHGIVSRCRGCLSRVGAHTLGVVLNGVRTTAGGYLRKNYDTFYDYHEIEA